MSKHYQSTNDIYATIRKRMKELRGTRTQDYMSDLLGVSRWVYSRIESGKQDPNLPFLIDLANLSDTTIAYLVGETDKK